MVDSGGCECVCGRTTREGYGLCGEQDPSRARPSAPGGAGPARGSARGARQRWPRASPLAGARGSDPELRQLLVQALARDAEGDRGLRLVVAVLAQRLGDEPALDLLHHLLERALLRRDARDRALDLAQARRQIGDLDPVAG